MADLTKNTYPNKTALACALADRVAETLDKALQAEGRAVLAVSGGSTPKTFFAELSKANIDWAGITVTLVDERWVPETDDRSNGRLVRETLLQGPAAAARLMPLYTGHDTPEEAAEDLERAFKKLGGKLDVAVLGMGTDGHTASFFAGGDHLEAATNPSAKSAFQSIRSTAALAQEPRITFTLPPLIAADLLVLHIEGGAKSDVLTKARQPGSIEEYPIRAVLENAESIQVYWCP